MPTDGHERVGDTRLEHELTGLAEEAQRAALAADEDGRRPLLLEGGVKTRQEVGRFGTEDRHGVTGGLHARQRIEHMFDVERSPPQAGP